MLAPKASPDEITEMKISPKMPMHIFVDEVGRAWIEGSNVKVIEVVRDHLAYGWSPEEIHWQYPHLALAEIYAALSFYHDNRESLDTEIKIGTDAAVAAAQALTDSPLALRLKSLSRA